MFDKVGREEFQRGLVNSQTIKLTNYHIIGDMGVVKGTVTMTTTEAIKLLADALGMEFQTEAAMPSLTVLVKKREANV
jgi:hypothetical protein